MEYTVQKLARLAGVSARTLRYYDEVGLLKPARISANGYRIYGEAEVDTLQQILFFRALGLELSTIAAVMHDPAFDRLSALQSHLHALEDQRARLELLIGNVQKTIEKEEGRRTMSDKEKFEGFKQRMIDDNEKQYGEEIRQKYGDEAIDESNARMMKLSQADYDAMQRAAADILQKLEAAVESGESPQGDAGREITALHRQWLGYTWAQYSAEAHKGLAQMYVDDPRFAAYYDDRVPGCAQFLRDAVTAWADKL